MICSKIHKNIRIAFVMLAFALVFSTGPLALAIEPEDKWEGPIDYAATSGSFLEDTCYAGPTGCIPGEFDNQGDRISATSTAGLYSVPDGVNIVKAYLIWMGSVNNPDPAIDNTLTFLPPSGEEHQILADEEDIIESIQEGTDADDQPTIFHYYTYRVDITGIMQSHNQDHPLNGQYTVKDFQGYAGEPYLKRQIVQAGWSLFMVYSKSGSQTKRIYFYSYFDQVRDEIITLEPTGFLAPESAEAKFTIFVGEGDESIEGSGAGIHDEKLSFNNYQLTDTCNSETNVFNSTVTTNLKIDESCRSQIYSVDLDTFLVGEYLETADTSAEIKLSVGQDMIITNYFVLSLSSRRSDFDIPDKPEKAASTLTGGFVTHDENFTYYIYVQNNGEEAATDVKVKDQLPSQVEYISNSTYVVEPDGTRRKIEDLSGGYAPSLNGIDIASTMPPGEDYRRIVEIGVKLKAESSGVSKGDIVNNTAEIIFNRNDVYFTNGGEPVSHTVNQLSYEGTLKFSAGKKHIASKFVKAGEKIVIAQINIAALEGDVSLNSLNFIATDESTASFIESAELYLDLNDNGQTDSSDKALGTVTNWSGGGLAFNDLSLLGSLKKNNQQNLVLVVTLSNSANAGQSVQLQLTEENVSVKGFTSGLPLNTAILYLANENTALSVEPGYENPANGYITPASQSTLIQLKLKSYRNPVSIQQFSFELSGTLYDPTEIESLTLFKDSDADGIFTANDIEIATTTISEDNQIVVFANLAETLAKDSEMNYAVEARLAESIGNEKTLQLSASSIIAGQQLVEGLPVSGGLLVISNSITSCDSDNDCLSLGTNWYCNKLLSLCEEAEVDGDSDNLPDGDTDPDGDTGITDPEGDKKGCNNISANFSFAAIVLLLLYFAIIGRRIKIG